ncbi:hypothetical protein A3K86_14905 [Photobacterium jeanii]|uniref:DUF2271 domain-containing protein n=1 Tax=Photobacterium jeanii TaxID=858640 RepID=A0A178K6Q5_9GAMM|nr:DUF2271 domain-containing protein [Photobacterium jeanii]OAN12961.1 hypothetical protein A3K86_14905 [Photobacterium jeanii]PST89108.1 DUF2271 domain-containing protein [Photobacterium jeanii]
MKHACKRMLKLSALAAVVAMPLMTQAKPLPLDAQMDVSFELPLIQSSNYNRPYVAVWIEGADRQPVRTLELWVGKDEWLKDLRSWWRKVGRYDRALVDGVTSATRPAGEYRFVWDGKNHAGERVEQGEYTFYAEVVREHGGRSLLRKKLDFGTEGFSVDIKPTDETGKVKLNYKVK